MRGMLPLSWHAYSDGAPWFLLVTAAAFAGISGQAEEHSPRLGFTELARQSEQVVVGTALEASSR
jgi:hypothetical protein